MIRKRYSFSKEYSNLIRVIEKRDVSKEFKSLQPFFNTAWMVNAITHPYARESGTAIAVFQGARISINAVIKAEIKRLNKKE